MSVEKCKMAIGKDVIRMEYAREDKHIMNIPRKKKKQNVSWNRNEKRRLNSEQYTIENLKLAYKHIEASQVNSFKDFPLSFKTLKGLKECGYIKPTEIQRESIGLSLSGSDVLGAAKTGSGKTLAFLIPVLELLYCKQWTRLDGVGALIITPTRELAYQIFEMLRKVGHFHDVSAGLIIGGKDLHFEKKRLDQCNIVICTPGRLLQHMDENPLFNCDNLQILVLDEADRCLDLGFEATMNNIIENLPPKRQTLLFSATQTKSVRDLARLSLKDPMYVSVHEHAKYSTPESLRQSYVVCELHEKINMLWSFIRNHLKQKILVFMSSCKQVKYCYEMFCRLRPGSSLLALYGTLHQLRRMAIYESFCRKSNVVMFATDIAARGLDFPEVNWVVQLDCPEDANTYIHRAGRTARYHKGGESVLVLLPSEEEGMIEELAAKKIPISKIKLNPAKLQSPQRKMEALLARDPSLKESAQRAFVSYMKSVFLMKNKKVFKVHLLDAELYSRSLGLAVPPRIRFLQKLLKQQGQETSKLEDGTTESNKVSEVDEPYQQESGNSSACSSIQDTDDIHQVPDSFNFENGDSDSDVDILKVKRKDHELDIGIPLTDEIPENTKNKKAVTKVAVAKKILKKKIIANKKIIFNNEGEAVLHPTKDKISDIAREYENEVKDGIDIEEARKVLREEDKYDKQRFREKIKAKHREEKLKLKKARNEERKEEAEEEIDGDGGGGGDDDDEEEESVPDLSWLPDPDKVFPSEERESKSSQTVSDDDDMSDSNSSEEELNQKHKSVSLKRKKSYSTRRKRQKTEFSENNPSLKEDEELALQLLKSVK